MWRNELKNSLDDKCVNAHFCMYLLTIDFNSKLF